MFNNHFSLLKSDRSLSCVFHNSIHNQKYRIYLENNLHVQPCSAKLETQHTYCVADIDLCFANIIECWQHLEINCRSREWRMGNTVGGKLIYGN
jgi:hypothetical protein